MAMQKIFAKEGVQPVYEFEPNAPSIFQAFNKTPYSNRLTLDDRSVPSTRFLHADSNEFVRHALLRAHDHLAMNFKGPGDRSYTPFSSVLTFARYGINQWGKEESGWLVFAALYFTNINSWFVVTERQNEHSRFSVTEFLSIGRQISSTAWCSNAIEHSGAVTSLLCKQFEFIDRDEGHLTLIHPLSGDLNRSPVFMNALAVLSHPHAFRQFRQTLSVTFNPQEPDEPAIEQPTWVVLC